MIKVNASRDRTSAQHLLVLSEGFSPEDLQRAYRAAVKRVHPDRRGGNVQAFQTVVEAYEILRASGSSQPAMGAPSKVRITPTMALEGGEISVALSATASVQLPLPPGLREGDRIELGDRQVVVSIENKLNIMVRGDDVWMDVSVDLDTLPKIGRVGLETPLGRRVVWMTQHAHQRGLVKLTGQGLPARGLRQVGHLFLRLSADQVPSNARNLLAQVAANWAA